MPSGRPIDTRLPPRVLLHALCSFVLQLNTLFTQYTASIHFHALQIQSFFRKRCELSKFDMVSKSKIWRKKNPESIKNEWKLK